MGAGGSATAAGLPITVKPGLRAAQYSIDTFQVPTGNGLSPSLVNFRVMASGIVLLLSSKMGVLVLFVKPYLRRR